MIPLQYWLEVSPEEQLESSRRNGAASGACQPPPGAIDNGVNQFGESGVLA